MAQGGSQLVLREPAERARYGIRFLCKMVHDMGVRNQTNAACEKRRGRAFGDRAGRKEAKYRISGFFF